MGEAHEGFGAGLRRVCLLWALFLCAGPALADSLDDGVAAYERGDYQAAIDVWMPLADTGNADALFNMGQLYRMGRGVARDPVMAEYFYRQAAQKGHRAAMGNLGTLYFFGFDDSPRADVAIEWWQKAARAGDPRSQYMMGILYYNGTHLKKDPVRAYAWIRRAAEAGLPDAVEAESKLIRALSVQQLADGNILSARVHELPVRMRTATDQGIAEDPPAPRPDAPDPLVVPVADKADDPENGEISAEEISGYYVQLAALGSLESADVMKQELAGDLPLLTAEPDMRIEEGARDDGSAIYRLLLGGFISREKAALRCARIQEAGRDCFVVSR